LHERYSAHKDGLAKIVKIPEGNPDSGLYEEIAYGITRALPLGLTDAQFVDIHRLLHKKIKRIEKEDMLLPPTDEQWEQWVSETEASIDSGEFDLETHERLLAQLGAVISAGKPDAYTFTLINLFNRRMRAAVYALDEGYRQISAWFDISPVQVKRKVTEFILEYEKLVAEGNPPETDPMYATGYKMTSGQGPKDDATVWAHYMAENPELYDPSVVKTKFVAMDVETQGTTSATDRILQIGLVEYDHEGVEVRRFVSYVRPPADENGVLFTGDEGAIAAHGILPDDLVDAPKFAEIAPIIREYFDGTTAIGQNLIQFDAAYLRAEYARLEPDEHTSKSVWPRAADTLWHAHRWIGKHVAGNMKLGTLITHFGLPTFEAHDAGEDAAASATLFFHIRNQLKVRQIAAYEKRRANDEWNL
jgi:DNA polymerase III epsilon subunit-like protein